MPTRSYVLGVALLATLFAGCIGGDDDLDPASMEDADADLTYPIHALPDTITGLRLTAQNPDAAGGQGIWIDEERALVYSSTGGSLVITDVTDPTAPVTLGTITDVAARDVDLLTWDNRSYALLSGSSEGIHIIDVEDPEAPVLLASADAYASHNLASVPGTPYVYNSGSYLPEQIIPVLDITDPSKPTWHVIDIPMLINHETPVQSDGCHDITVRVDLGRAYCAGGGGWYASGGGETLIMDIVNPLEPSWLGVVDNPSIIYHHQALASADGDLLYINDEYLAPNCFAADVPVGPRGQIGVPTGAMWIYDISEPANPTMLSWVQPPSAQPNAICSSHFGDIVDGTSMLVWGWYQGGTLLIDVSDPADPVIQDQFAQPGSLGPVPTTASTWDARYFNGHVYASGSVLEVLELVQAPTA